MKLKLIFILVFSTACGPILKYKAKDVAHTPAPTQEDQEIEINENGVPRDLFSEKENTVNSADMFRAAEDLMWVGKRISGEQGVNLSRFGHQLVSKFYENANNYSAMPKQSTMFVEAALGLYGEDLRSEIRAQLKDADALTKKAFENVQINIERKESVDSTFGGLLSQLGALPQKLKENKAPSVVVNGLTAELQKIVPSATELLPLMKQLKSDNKLEQNVIVLKAIIEKLAKLNLMSASTISQIESDAKTPAKVNDLLKSAKEPKHIFEILVTLFQYQQKVEVANGLKGKELEEKLKKSFPQEMGRLVEALVGLDDKDFAYLLSSDGSFSFLHPVLSITKKKALESLAAQSINDLVSKIDIAVSSAVVDGFLAAIVSHSKNILELVRSRCLQNISEENLRWKGDFNIEIHKLTLEEMQKIIFAEKNALPAIEKETVELNYTQKNGLTFQSTQETSFISSAESIATSISANAERLSDVTAEGITTSSKEFYQILFGQINKLLAIGGYRDMRGDEFSSLHLPIRNARRTNLEIYAYDVETGYFAIPEKVLVQNSFNIYRPKADIGETVLTATVAGQAEMLRAASNMMNYFKSWDKSSFDDSFSGLTYKGINVFPKDAFFDLSLGLAAVVLRNLQRGGLVLFDETGAQIKISKGPNALAEAAKSAVSAALVNVSTDGDGTVVRLADVSKFILALEVFLNASEGVEKSNSKALNEEINGEKPNMKAMIEAKKVLRKLMLGLMNYLATHLQSKDGGVYSEYSLDENRVRRGVRNLQDQLLYEKALLAVYRIWGGDVYKFAAVDNYYFLNKRFYDPKISFYRNCEGGACQSYNNFQLYAQSIRVVQEMINEIQKKNFERAPNLDRLKKLQKSWMNTLLRYSKST